MSGDSPLEVVTGAVVGFALDPGTAVLSVPVTAGLLSDATVDGRSPVLEPTEDVLTLLTLARTLLTIGLETPVPGPLTPAGVLLNFELEVPNPVASPVPTLERMVPGAVFDTVVLGVLASEVGTTESKELVVGKGRPVPMPLTPDPLGNAVPFLPSPQTGKGGFELCGRIRSQHCSINSILASEDPDNL